MIRLELDQYSFKGHAESPDICADVDAEGAALVQLTVELEPGEMAPHVRAPALDEAPEEAALVDRLAQLRHKNDVLSARAEAFEQALERVRQEREVGRILLPQEARELAAMLRHYADEAERR